MFYQQPVDDTAPLSAMPAAGGAGEQQDRLALLGDAGGVGFAVSESLAALADEGGWVDLWTKYVPLVLLPYLCHSWGPLPWRPRCAGPAFLNTEQTASCPACSTGDPVTVAAGEYSSSISQEDADAQALAAAEAQLVCEEPEPEFTLDVESRGADFSLDGYEEFVPSATPRYYKTKTLYGEKLYECQYSGDGCGEGMTFDGSYVFEWRDGAGSSTFAVAWPAAYGSIYLHEWQILSGGGSCGANSGAADYVNEVFDGLNFPGSAVLPVDSAGFEEFEEAERRGYRGLDACKVNAGDSNTIGHGEVREELTNEHTPCAAFAEELAAAAPAWGLPTTYNQAAASGGLARAETSVAWKADAVQPRDWEGQEQRWTVHIANLLAGCPYKIRWYQDGAWQEHEFTAAATTATYTATVPCGSAATQWAVVRN